MEIRKVKLENGGMPKAGPSAGLGMTQEGTGKGKKGHDVPAAARNLGYRAPTRGRRAQSGVTVLQRQERLAKAVLDPIGPKSRKAASVKTEESVWIQ